MRWTTRLAFALVLFATTSSTFGTVIDVGPGQLYTTIQSGYAAASSGDTLRIYDGVYHFPSTLNVTRPVTFQAVNIGGPRLSGGGSGLDDSILFLSANATFSGLFFSGSNSAHAIYQRDTGAHGIIRNSIFVGIADPVHINNSAGTAGSFDVAHATVVNAGGAFGINDGGTISIVNSIIANSGLAYGAHANIVITPEHNLLFNVATVAAGGGTIASDPAEIIADPLFVDPAGLDFRLLAGSPAIDSGLFFGQPFAGAAPDRGAFEFQPAANVVFEPASILVWSVSLAGLCWFRRGKR